jgi:RNA polymerase sigma-70 factor (ECF subfamily)
VRVSSPAVLAACSDEDLLRLVATGSREAFAAFYDRTSALVVGLVRRILVDPALSEQVALDVYLEAWRCAALFDPSQGRALSWLLTSAYRRSIDLELATSDAA